MDIPMKALLKLLLTPIVRRVLRDSLPPRDVTCALKETWQTYDRIVPTLPREPTWGGWLMVRLAACVVGLYRALLKANVAADDAARLVSTASWLVYAKMAVPPRLLAAILTRDPGRRLKVATDLFRRFPFGPPSYRMENVPAGPGVVAFDVLRCPVAELFKREGHPELCVRTFCNLDFPLARAWGGELERTCTIAGSDKRCDFRWRVPLPVSQKGPVMTSSTCGE
jgi:ubiquinone biosynthesis protein